MQLYKHQKKLVDLAPERHLLAWGTGTGKSLAAIKVVEENNAADLPAMIVCPKSLKEKWQEDIDEFAKCSEAWIVITKEEFRRDWEKFERHDFLVLDEAHYFAGQKSQMHKNAIKFIKKWDIDYIYALTATPYLSSPWNIFALAKLLKEPWNYAKFKYHFFSMVPMGPRLIPVAKKYAGGRPLKEEVAKWVKYLGSTVKMSECVDVPEQTFLQEYFDLTRDQESAIHEIEDVLPIVQFTKEHQICGGTLKGNEYEEDQFFASQKLKRLLDIMGEMDKVVIVCRYNNEINYLYREISKKYPTKLISVINGENKDRHYTVQEAEKSDDCVVLVNAACSEGYELPSFPVMIFYSYDFSLKNYIQMIGRIQRINTVKKNIYISLIVRKSIDEDIYKCIMNKKDFDIAIFSRK